MIFYFRVMKKILLLLLLPVFSFAQPSLPVPVVNGKIVYEGVVSVDSANKYDLYYRAKRFLINEFKNTKGGLYQDDKEGGVIIGKGITPFVVAIIPGLTHWVLEIDLKDGKYRYRIDNIEYEYFYGEKSLGIYPLEDMLKKINRKELKFLKNVNLKMVGLIESLKSAMLIKPNNDF